MDANPGDAAAQQLVLRDVITAGKQLGWACASLARSYLNRTQHPPWNLEHATRLVRFAHITINQPCIHTGICRPLS